MGATRLTFVHILERTRDTDEHVMQVPGREGIKSLTNGRREGVLGRGLGERSEAVRRVVEKEMILAWLRLSNNNVQLLHHLDAGNFDQATKQGSSTPAGALYVLFMDTYKELVNSFQYLSTDKLIHYEKNVYVLEGCGLVPSWSEWSWS